jgi:hypothetical protein
MSVQSISRRSGIECAVMGLTFRTPYTQGKQPEIISWINSLHADGGIIIFSRLLAAQFGERFSGRNLIDYRCCAEGTGCFARSENEIRRLDFPHWCDSSHDRSNIDLIFGEMGTSACRIRSGRLIGHAVVQQVPV